MSVIVDPTVAVVQNRYRVVKHEWDEGPAMYEYQIQYADDKWVTMYATMDEDDLIGWANQYGLPMPQIMTERHHGIAHDPTETGATITSFYAIWGSWQ